MRRKLFVPCLLALLLTATPFFGAVTKYETDTRPFQRRLFNSHCWRTFAGARQIH